MCIMHNFVSIWRGLSTGPHSESDDRITQPLLFMHADDDGLGDI